MLDYFSRVIATYRSDGRHSETQWGCCGKEYERDENGVKQIYYYDAMNRVEQVAKEGDTATGQPDVFTSFTYDAEGRQLSQTVSAGSLSQSTFNVYDLAGRLVRNSNPAGLVTEYSYDGLAGTTVRAGLTNTTVRALDGSVRYAVENGIIKSHSEHGVNQDGTRWTTVSAGPANDPQSTLTTTIDMLGHVIREERPGFGAQFVPGYDFWGEWIGPMLANEYSYNTKGQLVRSVVNSPDSTVSNIYEYDELGNQIRSGLDLNANGVLDLAGPDRVNDSSASYQSDTSNNWWRVQTSVIYASDNSSVPTTSGVQKVRLTGLGSTSDLGLLTSDLVSIDLLGNPTVSRTYVDRATKTVTQTVTYQDSTSNSVKVTVNGLLQYSTTKTGVRTDYSCDTLGRQVSATTSGGSRSVATVTHYNTFGQVDWTEDGATNRTTYAYDSAGHRTAVTDPLSQTIYTAYDSQNRILATWGATYPVSYGYDDYGRMTNMCTLRDTSVAITDYSSFIDHRSSFDCTSWQYDLATGLLTNKLYADGKGTSYTYTPDGKLASRKWARGIVTTYRYDATLGAMTNIVYSDNTPPVGFVLNRLGQQIAVTDGTGRRTFTYNDAMQLAVETNAMGVIGRQYDSIGRNLGFAFGSDYAVTYAYDGVGRLSSLTSDLGLPTSAFSYSYLHNSGLLTGWGNGTIQVMRKYEPNRDLLVAVTNLAGGSLVSAFDYQNDPIGRRTQRHDQFGPVPSEVENAFSYNSRSELITADMGANHYGYAYDPIGNRTAATNNDDTTTYTANQLNQYTAIADGVTIVPAYDIDGNLTNDSHFYYTWDGENRLVLASNATIVVSNSYDYMSRRTRTSVFTKDSESWPRTSDACFEYDGWNLVRELITDHGSPITNIYVWGLDLAEQSGAGVPRHSALGATAGGIGGLLSVTRRTMLGVSTYYPCYDANGNIGDYVDAGGTVVAHREYDAYGNTVTVSGSMVNDFNFWFSSKYLDKETGLYYYGYRFFSSGQGRWLGREILGEHFGKNLYCYVDNDSPDFYDVLGLWKDGHKGHWQTGEYPGHSDFERYGDGADAFDWTLEDRGSSGPDPRTGNTAGHFQDLGTSAKQVRQAIANCNKEDFERKMHRLQDFWSHYNKGYKWEPDKALGRALLFGLVGVVIGELTSPRLGHGLDSVTGRDPDNDVREWVNAATATHEFLKQWDSNCCLCGKTWNVRSTGPCGSQRP